MTELEEERERYQPEALGEVKRAQGRTTLEPPVGYLGKDEEHDARDQGKDPELVRVITAHP